MLSIKDITEINKEFSSGTLMNESSLAYAVSTTQRSRNWLKAAATYTRAILIDHTFENGNKRTAAAVIMLIMDISKVQFNPERIPHIIVRLLKANTTNIKEIERCIKNAPWTLVGEFLSVSEIGAKYPLVGMSEMSPGSISLASRMESGNDVVERAKRIIAEYPEVFQALLDFETTKKIPKMYRKSRLNVTIDENLLRKFKSHAGKKGINISKFIESRMIEELVGETALLSEKALAKEWSTPEEDKAWENL